MKRKEERRKNLLLSCALIVALVILDQVLKVWARLSLIGRPVFSYFGGFVQVEYAENKGAFLSLGAQLSDGVRSALFIFGASAMLLFCAYWLWRAAHQRLYALALALVIAGGIGNLIDRIMRGSVTDYIHMGFTSLRTGVFNLADVAISLGFCLLLLWQNHLKEDEN